MTTPVTDAAGGPGKMWSGRFREPLDPRFEAWQRSFPFDWRLLPQEVQASKAHARALAAAGLLSEEELSTMLAGLDAVGELRLEPASLFDASAAAHSSMQAAEDVHHFVELELTRHIGSLALKLHTGRSRNEQIATDLRLYVRESSDRIARGLRAWAVALIEAATAAGDAVMPSYTHLQRAEPVLVAHWLLAYVEMAERDLERLADARRRTLRSPLGSGAIAGATLPLDRQIAADALGFGTVTRNSMDATSDRDFAVEFAQALSLVGVHVSRFAEEITLFATAEFGFVELPERFSTGSSAMPQKKNPDFTELLRGKSARLLAGPVRLLTLLKGLPLAYNKDLQEGQEALFDLAETAEGLVELLGPFTASLRLRTERMRAAAQKGYLNAMAGATYLSMRGVPFRKAHEQIGAAVRYALDSGRELEELSLEELARFGEEFREDFFDAITLEATLACHDVVGGTAPGRVQAELQAARARLAEASK